MAASPPIDHERFFASSPNPVAVLNPDCTVVAANHGYEAVIGRPREELVGRTLFDLYASASEYGLDPISLNASLKRVIDHGETDVIEPEAGCVALNGAPTSVPERSACPRSSTPRYAMTRDG
ncbi:PAS domain-containing protein [Aquisalimonas lutea]|uniref:PAS domain-containing protein n=1 Tax=Aquisalimonas lutea TaxID=1327750 RepID=UPI0025B43AFE|nr:PAS domain-containing protein [Aquisalimonas lutea]MDN3519702.1 PAS domain-containing protein [Aquisalimonas lutea]